MGLNFDCQLQVLEVLDIASLVSLYETNKRLSSLVEYVIQQKFAKKSVTIVTPFANNEFYDQTEINDSITINDFRLASKVLKYFGHLIVHLELDFPSTDNQIEEIEELVNLHCSNTLTELIVRADNGDIFRSMTRPFQKVENIRLKKHIKNLCNKLLNFSDLFPSLRRLNFVYVKVSDTRCIEQIFPNLEHLQIDVNHFETSEYFTEPVLERFMQKNRHIRSLTLQLVTPSVLKLVAENLPELEYLEVQHYYETNDTNNSIHFGKVKRFVMKQSSFSAPNNVIFDELMDLHIDGLPKYCRRWFQFIEMHPQLQRIEVTGRDLNASDIMRMAHSHFNVSEISLHSSGNVDSHDIAYLIKHTNLQSIILKESVLIKRKYHDCHNSTSNYLRDDQISIERTLRQFFGDKWNVNENHSEIIIQKRNGKY